MKVEKGPTAGAPFYNPSLSSREVTLLATWERERRISVTTEDIRQEVGVAVAKDVVRGLIAKKVLQRVGRGIYLIRPLRSLLRPTAPSSALLAAVLLKAEPYYIGGLWAFTFHRLTDQQYASGLDAFVSRRRPGRRLGAARISFHPLPAGRLSYGVTSAQIEGVMVRISDPERTLLDALDHPSLVKDARKALSLFHGGLARATTQTLVEYAVRGSRHSTCQRLGVILERSGVSPRRLARLHRKARETRSLLSMLPGAPRTGPVNKRWNVVENDE